MASALEHPEIYLRQELLLTRAQLPTIQGHISPFGVIPKRAKPAPDRRPFVADER